MHMLCMYMYYVFKVPPTAKVSSDRLKKRGIKPAIPGLQREQFIHYTTEAPQAHVKVHEQLPSGAIGLMIHGHFHTI